MLKQEREGVNLSSENGISFREEHSQLQSSVEHDSKRMKFYKDTSTT